MNQIDVVLSVCVVAIVVLIAVFAFSTNRERKKWDEIAKRYNDDFEDAPFRF